VIKYDFALNDYRNLSWVEPMEVFLREPQREDEADFVSAMQRSQHLHQRWIEAPLTSDAFQNYLRRSQQTNCKSFLVRLLPSQDLVGVFNMSEIVRGFFQSAYLGFYAVADYAGKGYMSTGLKLVLQATFTELNLHRLEANIQPENHASIQLVANNGFRYEGFSPRYLKVNGEWRDHERWAITIEDWS